MWWGPGPSLSEIHFSFSASTCVRPGGTEILERVPGKAKRRDWGEVEDCNALCSWGELR